MYGESLQTKLLRDVSSSSPLPMILTDGEQTYGSVSGIDDFFFSSREHVGSAAEALGVMRLQKHNSKAVIGFKTNEYGLLARALAGKYGSRLVHGVVEKGGPGEPTVQQLLEVYRIKKQTAATKVFGIVGKPVSHDLGFLLHNAFFEHSGEDAVYVPLLVDELAPFLDAFTGPDFGGFSVTMPHKATALALAQHIDPIARDCGAANTLVAVPAKEPGSGGGSGSEGSSGSGGGEWSAHNTDWLGAVGAIEAGLTGQDLHDCYVRAACAGSTPGGSGSDGKPSPLAGQSVVVVGVGGAGSAIAFGAVRAGAQVMVADQDAAKAEALAVRLGATAVPMSNLEAGRVKAHVLANATPLGMIPNVTTASVPASTLGNFTAVFDAVYTPLQTQLLKDAAAAGCIPISGLEMFLGQGAEQFRLFTGGRTPPPAATMRKYITDHIATLG